MADVSTSHAFSKKSIVAAFLILVALTVLADSAFAQGYQRIKTEETFRGLVVGKALTGERGWGRFLSDGSMDGSFNGLVMRGAWVWRRNFLCRNVKLGDQPALGTNCLVVKVNGNKLRIIRENGRGQVVDYTLE